MTDVDHRPPDPALLERLERHLGHLAGDVPVRRSPVSAAITRARQRQHRRNAAVAGGSLAVVLVAVTVVAVVQRPPSPPTDGDRTGTSIAVDTTVTEPTTPTTGATPPTTATTPPTTAAAPPTTAPPSVAPVVASGVDVAPLVAPDGADPTTWTFGNSGIAWTRSEEGSGSPVYVSDDGVSWRALTVDASLQVWRAERDTTGIIRIVGAFTDIGATNGVLLTSADGGDTWSSVVLPVELVAPGVDPTRTSTSFDASIASRGDTAVVAVNNGGYRRWLLTVLADGSVIDASDTGLDLGDQLPMDEATRFIGNVIADEQGFAAVGGVSSDVTTLTYFTSADGRSWSALGASESSGLIGRLGGELISPLLTTSADGTTWEALSVTRDLGAGMWAPWKPQRAIVRDGTLVVLLFADGSQAPASFVKDGFRVEVSPNLDTSFYENATGEYLGGFAGNVYDGPVRTVGATFELLDDSGNVRVSVSLDEATEAIQGLEEQPDEWAVATTTDLADWTLQAIVGRARTGTMTALHLDLVDGRPTVTLATLGLSGVSAALTVIRTPP